MVTLTSLYHHWRGMAWGALVGLVGTLYGMYKLKEAKGDIERCLSTLDVPIDHRVNHFFESTNFMLVPQFVIYIYGQREFSRRYDHKCHHHEGLVYWAFKSAFCKPVIGCSILLNALACVIGLLVVNAVYVFFQALQLACDSSDNAIEDILNLMNSHVIDDDDLSNNFQSTIDDVCEAIGQGVKGGETGTSAMIVAVAAQLLTMAYWMKYSTLGYAPEVPFPNQKEIEEKNAQIKRDNMARRRGSVGLATRRGSNSPARSGANTPATRGQTPATRGNSPATRADSVNNGPNRTGSANNGPRRGNSASKSPQRAKSRSPKRGSTVSPNRRRSISDSIDNPPEETLEQKREREAKERKEKQEQIHANLEQMRKQAQMLLKNPNHEVVYASNSNTAANKDKNEKGVIDDDIEMQQVDKGAESRSRSRGRESAKAPLLSSNRLSMVKASPKASPQASPALNPTPAPREVAETDNNASPPTARSPNRASSASSVPKRSTSKSALKTPSKDRVTVSPSRASTRSSSIKSRSRDDVTTPPKRSTSKSALKTPSKDRVTAGNRSSVSRDRVSANDSPPPPRKSGNRSSISRDRVNGNDVAPSPLDLNAAVSGGERVSSSPPRPSRLYAKHTGNRGSIQSTATTYTADGKAPRKF